MVRVVQEKCSQLKALIVSVFTFSFVIVERQANMEQTKVSTAGSLNI